ncbi:unnamed protein product [Discosporangium mesarthrocarpum]
MADVTLMPVQMAAESSPPGPPQAPPQGKRRPKQQKNSISTPKKLTHVVVDSGAIIKGAGMTLFSSSENFWTVPEVVNEIRDKKARHHLDALPFELKLREPSDEAMKFVSGFARQTGDLRALSRVDLKVIALAYMLENQETGGAHLRTSPAKLGSRANGTNTGRDTGHTAAATQEKNTATPNGSTTPCSAVDLSLQAVTHSQGPQEGGEGRLDLETVVVSGGKEAVTEEEAGKGADDGDVDSLCSAVREAWKDETRGGGGMGGEGEGVEDEEEEGEGEGLEDPQEEEGAGEEAEGEEDGGESGDEEDDDWEPEDTRNAAAAGKEALESTVTNVGFSATKDDFPALGGGATSESATSTTAGMPGANVTEPAISWSLMARSNPAPFKAGPKPDPAPLKPTAEAVAAIVSGEGSGVGDLVAPTEPATEEGESQRGEKEEGARQRYPGRGAVGSSRILGMGAVFGTCSDGVEDDDGEGWVNPSNFRSQKAAGIELDGPSQRHRKGGPGGGARRGRGLCRAGCVTTDFAMQNVLLQVGLPLISLDGMSITSVKQWILRCSACFKTCTDMGRLFCPSCGSGTMSRVSCQVDARTGALRVFLKKNWKNNLRGTKYSIPRADPTKRRFEGDILLREDQLLSGIWAQKTRRKVKDVSSMFGEDVTLNVGLTVSKSPDIVVGYGRRNPNAAKGRERRGKKVSKK